MRAFLPLLIAALATSAATSSPGRVWSSPAHSSRRHLSDSSAQNRRDLSAADWWYSLLNFLGAPCPPGHGEHGSCGPKHHGGGGGGGGGGSSGGGSSSGGSSSSSSSSGSSSSGGGSDDAASAAASWQDDGYAAEDYDDAWSGDDYEDVSSSGYDDAWQGDDAYWMENNLDGTGYGNESSQSKGVSAWPFVIGAVFVGALIALVVVKKRKQESEEGHPLEGSVKKRMKLFNGGIFRRNQSEKSATLNEESTFDDMEGTHDGTDNDSTPGYIEIGESVKTSETKASMVSRASSFRAALSRAGSKLSLGRSRSGARQDGGGQGTYNAPRTMGFDDETIDSADYARGVEL